MLYIFHGTDEAQARSKTQALITGLRKKAPEAEYIRITEEEVETLNIDELVSSQGLFKSNYIVLFDGVLPTEGWEDLAQSEHVFVVLIGKVDAKTKKLFEKHATKATEYADAKKAERVNVFAIANALKARNKQQLWLALAELRLQGISGEELVGILFWAAKDMLLKQQFSKWQEGEVQALVTELAALPHQARRNAQSVHNALEAFALGV